MSKHWILLKRAGNGENRYRLFAEYGPGAFAVRTNELFTEAHRYQGWILIDI